MICIHTHTGAGAEACEHDLVHEHDAPYKHFINRFRMLQLENIFIRIKAKLLACMCVVDAGVSVSLIASSETPLHFSLLFFSFSFLLPFTSVSFLSLWRPVSSFTVISSLCRSIWLYIFISFLQCLLSGRFMRLLPPCDPPNFFANFNIPKKMTTKKQR